MADEPRDLSASPGAVPVRAHPVRWFAWGECNWTHLLATACAPVVQQCPWCGWEDVERHQAGAFASFVCSVHGRVTCVITEELICVNDYMDLYWTHRWGIPRGRSSAEPGAAPGPAGL
jgi:hypothetical protein